MVPGVPRGPQKWPLFVSPVVNAYLSKLNKTSTVRKLKNRSTIPTNHNGLIPFGCWDIKLDVTTLREIGAGFGYHKVVHVPRGPRVDHSTKPTWVHKKISPVELLRLPKLCQHRPIVKHNSRLSALVLMLEAYGLRVWISLPKMENEAPKLTKWWLLAPKIIQNGGWQTGQPSQDHQDGKNTLQIQTNWNNQQHDCIL